MCPNTAENSSDHLNLANIVESTLVPHTAFETARLQIEQNLRYVENTCEPLCLAIIGEPRTGKSRVLEECLADHARYRTEEGLHVPILLVTTPSKPTVKGLAEIMLQEMEDPMPHLGSEQNKTLRLTKLIKAAGTKMLMIDEFQHFQDRGSNKVKHEVADWLKNFVNNTHIALVVAGLPECSAVIHQNNQLAGRFSAPMVMPRFDWTNEEQREIFIAILASFQESLGRYFDLPELNSSSMALRYYCGSGGLIGYLTKLWRQAVWNSLDKNTKIITLEDIAAAYCAILWEKEDIFKNANPFTRDFFIDDNVEIIKKIQQIGRRPFENAPEPRKGNRKVKIPTAGQILSSR
jgi:hypothetical protein